MAHQPENCKEVFAMLSEYLDMALSSDACEQIEEHLAGCVPCVEFVNSLRKSIELCRGYDTGVRPAPLTAEKRAELERAWQELLRSRALRPGD